MPRTPKPLIVSYPELGRTILHQLTISEQSIAHDILEDCGVKSDFLGIWLVERATDTLREELGKYLREDEGSFFRVYSRILARDQTVNLEQLSLLADQATAALEDGDAVSADGASPKRK
jgi:hypothetical protein